MKNNLKHLLTGCILLSLVMNLIACGSNNNSETIVNGSTSISDEFVKLSKGKTQGKNSSDSKTDKNTPPIVWTDLEPSNGLEFESNGDGTCTLVGIGICKDTDIVIPVESPDGETVTLIGEYAFYDLEDVDSVTFVNYNYEIDEYAFEYGEFSTLNIIGGSPLINKSAFSSCEDLTSILFSDCNIQFEEYAFFGCGKDADVTFSNCTSVIGEYAFQYSDFINLTISNCTFEIEKSAFSSCEDLASIRFTDSTIEADEYAFFSCGDSAKVEMRNCSLSLDDRAFQYSSFDSLEITGSKVEMGESVFSSCEDLITVNIDCDLVTLDEYAFFGCEDLESVTICKNSKSDNEINIDDRAFQYCDKLKTVTVGKGNIEIGKYVFSGCDDNLKITIAGKNYNEKMIQDGLK